MRLVWVVIPLILIVSMIGIVGVEESFATEPCTSLLKTELLNRYDHVFTAEIVAVTPLEIFLTPEDYVISDDLGHANYFEESPDDKKEYYEKFGWTSIDYEVIDVYKGEPDKHWNIQRLTWVLDIVPRDPFPLKQILFFIANNNPNNSQISPMIPCGGSDLYLNQFDDTEKITNYGDTDNTVVIQNNDSSENLKEESNIIFYPSPKKQFESGIASKNIICKVHLELIFKSSNNSPTCVKPSTAEKLIQRGWEIISESTLSQISYEYPLSSNDFKSGDETENVVTSEPVAYPVTTELKISKLPKIGETAEVTLIISGMTENDPSAKYATPIFGISSSFEFVGIPQEKIETTFINYTSSSLRGEYITYTTYGYTLPALGDIAANDVRTYTVTIKAVAETKAVSKIEDRSSIGGGVSYSGNSFEVVVMKDQTILYKDFQSMYPDQVRVFTPLTIDDYPLDYVSPNVIFGNSSTPMTDSELRAFYENNGYTNEQIEEYIKENWKDSES